jgi:hypothetical protein
VAEDPIESDKVTKDEFYQVYQRYCTQNKLAVESKENFGRVLKKKYQYQDWRERREGVVSSCKTIVIYSLKITGCRIADIMDTKT